MKHVDAKWHIPPQMRFVATAGKLGTLALRAGPARVLRTLANLIECGVAFRTVGKAGRFALLTSAAFPTTALPLALN